MSFINEDELYLLSHIRDDEEKIIYSIKNKGKVLIKNSNTDLISNLISTNLCEQKTTMVVTNENIEDEIVKRLDGIKSKIVHYNDSSSIDDIGEIDDYEGSISSSLKSKLDVLSRDIDKKVKILEDIKELFIKQYDCGLNLLEIYEKTSMRLTQYDERYKHYLVYKEKREFQGYKYKELEAKVEHIKSLDIINSYIKYRRFSNNKMFSKLSDEINQENIALAIYKISSILNNEWAFILPMINNKYSEAFMEVFIADRNVSEERLLELAKEINYKLNSEDDEVSYSKKVKKILGSIFKKKVGELNDDELEVQKIYSEYLENKENLTIFINAFKFLKLIITNEEFEEFTTKLLKEDEISEYLKTLKNTINIFENFKEVTSNIKKLEDSDLEILGYCYDNVERKEEISKLLSFIPDIYLYVYQDDIEEREKNQFNNYKEFEYIRNEVILSMKSKNEFVVKYINSYWSEYVSAISKESFIQIDDESEKNDFDIVRAMYPCLFIKEDNEDLYELIRNYSPECLIIVKNEKAFVLNYHIEDESDDAIEEVELPKLDDEQNNITKHSDFQKELYELIIKMGYECIKNVTISGYDVDLLVFDKNSKHELIAIEIDKSIYDLDSYSVRKDDIYKKEYLESTGVDLIRVWSRDWWNEKKEEIHRIKCILKK
ncbi:MAG: hypothetical protein RR620_04515 [Clostridium sp.]